MLCVFHLFSKQTTTIIKLCISYFAGKTPTLYKDGKKVEIEEIHRNMEVLALCTVNKDDKVGDEKPVLLKTLLKVYRTILPRLA